MIEHEDHCPEKGDRRCDCDYEAQIRNDERERGDTAASMRAARADERQRLRRQVEALPTYVVGEFDLAVSRFDVLGLIAAGDRDAEQ